MRIVRSFPHLSPSLPFPGPLPLLLRLRLPQKLKIAVQRGQRRADVVGEIGVGVGNELFPLLHASLRFSALIQHVIQQSGKLSDTTLLLVRTANAMMIQASAVPCRN